MFRGKGILVCFSVFEFLITAQQTAAAVPPPIFTGYRRPAGGACQCLVYRHGLSGWFPPTTARQTNRAHPNKTTHHEALISSSKKRDPTPHQPQPRGDGDERWWLLVLIILLRLVALALAFCRLLLDVLW